MTNFARQKQNGFTLIELLVTLSIVVLLTAAGLPYFRNFEKMRNLDEAAQLVRNGIMEAKNYGLAPRESKQAGLDRYTIAFDAGLVKNSFKIYEGTQNLPSSESNLVSTIALPANVEVSDVQPIISGINVLNIQFSIAEQGKISVQPAECLADNSANIVLHHITLSKFIKITVNCITGSVEIGTPYD